MRPPRSSRSFVRALLIFGAIALLHHSPLFAGDVRQLSTYFEALRQRGLHGVAERYALDRRREIPVDSAENVQLSIELSRTFADHARHVADAEEQAFLLEQADDALEIDSAKTPFPRQPALVLERALRAADRSVIQWWAWTADPDDADARQTASKAAAAARTALDDWIATPLPRKAAQDVADGELTNRELADLRRTAEVRRVEIMVSAGELATSPAGRSQSLDLADSLIEKLLPAVDRVSAEQLKLQRIRLTRLRGDEVRLRPLLQERKSTQLSATFRTAALVEQVRWELDQQRYEAAAKLLVDAKSAGEEVTDALRALHLEAVLGMSRSSTTNRAALLKSADEQQSRIASPWNLRTGFLLQQARDVARFGETAEPLVRQARRDYRAGRQSEAIAAFTAAAEAATSPAAQSELRFMTASLLVEQERFEEARRQCRSILQAGADNDTLAKSSLLESYCLGRLYSEDRTPSRHHEYETSLRTHLRRFAADATAPEASWMLGTLYQQDSRPAALIEADRAIPPDNPHSKDSLLRCGTAILAALQSIHAKMQAVDGWDEPRWNEESIRIANACAKPLEGQRSLAFDDLAPALLAARLRSATRPPRLRDATTLLDLIARSQPPADAAAETLTAWNRTRQEAEALRLANLAGQGDFRDASAILETLGAASTADLLALLKSLIAAGEQLEPARRAELARLQSATIARLRSRADKLTPQDRQLLTECEAESAFAAGRFDEAARLYEEAVVAQPTLIPRLAEALERTGKKSDLNSARKRWQEWGQKQPQGTPPWLEARLHVAHCDMKLGEAAEARRLIKATRLIYPDLGTPDLKRRYEELELTVR